MKIPEQIDPVIDPIEPELGSERYFYYLLQEPESPSVTPPNAVDVKQYHRAHFLFPDDPENFMVAYGFAEYERELSIEELEKYNMLPFDYDKGLLFRLHQQFEGDDTQLLKYCEMFFKVIKDDPSLVKFELVKKLRNRQWTLKSLKLNIKMKEQVK